MLRHLLRLRFIRKNRGRSKKNSRKNPADHNGDLREKNMVSEFITDVLPASVPHTSFREYTTADDKAECAMVQSGLHRRIALMLYAVLLPNMEVI